MKNVSKMLTALGALALAGCGVESQQNASETKAKYAETQGAETDVRSYLWAHSLPVVKLVEKDEQRRAKIDFITCWYRADTQATPEVQTEAEIQDIFLSEAKPINEFYTSRDRAIKLLETIDPLNQLREAYYDRYGTSVFETELIKQLGLPSVNPHLVVPRLEKLQSERYAAFTKFIQEMPYEVSDYGDVKELQRQIDLLDEMLPKLPPFLQQPREQAKEALMKFFDMALDHTQKCPVSLEEKREAFQPLLPQVD